MARIEFHIKNGVAQAMLTEEAKPLAAQLGASISRISHVEPVQPVLRWLFYLIRYWFGEDGETGRWLRTWRCRWRVNFGPIGGDVFDRDEAGKPFADRQAAIDFEIPRAVLFLKEGKHASLNSQSK